MKSANKTKTILRLKALRDKRIQIENMKRRLQFFSATAADLRAVDYSKIRVGGSGENLTEAGIVERLQEREDLKSKIEYYQEEIDLMNQNLAELTEKERLVIDRMLINREKCAVERLIGELGYEQAQIYRIRDAALKKLTIWLYGEM